MYKRMDSYSKRLRWLVVVIALLALVLLGLVAWVLMRGTDEKQGVTVTDSSGQTSQEPQLAGTPKLDAEVIIDGRRYVWDMAFLPSGQMIFTELGGTLSKVVGNQAIEIAAIEDVRAQGEGGLLGLAIDPEFDQNRYIYTCYNSLPGLGEDLDVRVVRWRINEDLTELTDRKDIVTGIPANPNGRHSGCQPVFGPDDYLWITTGDAAMAEMPQDPQSLAGKVLRVDRNGEPAAQGNLGGDFDPRIYSYGHRNMQGLAFLQSPRGNVSGVSVEHGPDVNDEVNQLLPGNFGWDPVPPTYNERVPMTDTEKYPDAIEAVWSSGDPTQAPSAAAFVYGTKWRDWNGALAVSQLKNKRVKFLFFDEQWNLTGQQDRFVDEFGRLRAAVLGPDNSLYVSTSIGNNDKIIRITPR